MLSVAGAESMEMALRLGRSEGIFTGISGGASVVSALKLAEKVGQENLHILTILPDTQERYMSSPLYSAIQEDMNDEELELSKSTPGFQLD